jgi:hypothetical protein
MTNEQLSAIRERLDKRYSVGGCFIDAIQDDLRALLDEVERLTAEVERLTAENDRLCLAVPRIIQVNDPEADRMFDGLQPSLGTPVPPERRIRRQADVDAAFARGVAAMREAAAKRCEVSPIHNETTTTGRVYANAVRSLPDLEDKS